tara:strand:+ start:454 stop:966 length:513 start_codon:yes stop_codon:yes gene_type:complete
MWKYTPTNKTIRPGMAWTDRDGARHPASWHTWSAAEKASHNVIEIADPVVPDSRLYTWAQNSDGSITSTPKDINDRTETIDGEVITFPGVKSVLMTQIKERQAQMLLSTDWAYVRKMDTNIDVPTDIQQWRDEIRLAAAAKEDQITQAADIDAIAAVINADGWNDWPELA